MFKTFFLLSLAFSAINAKANDHHKHHNHHSKKSSQHSHDLKHNNFSDLVLNKGEKWATDQPLRKNMEEIHDQLKLNMGLYKSDRLAISDYRTIGNSIKKNIHSIFKNCKLPAKADAQLHLIMADLMKANSQMTKSNSLVELKTAFSQTTQAYREYKKFFNTETM